MRRVRGWLIEVNDIRSALRGSDEDVKRGDGLDELVVDQMLSFDPTRRITADQLSNTF